MIRKILKKHIYRSVVRGAAAFLCVAAFAAAVWADAADDARALLDSGDYAGAREMAAKALLEDPEGTKAGTLNLILGMAMEHDGDTDEALDAYEKAMKRGVADAYRYAGRIAAQRYDFARAAEFYNKYVQLKSKSGEVPPEGLMEQAQVERARTALNSVDSVQVIDTLTVPREEFFKHYRLPAGGGHIVGPDRIPFEQGRDESTMAFLSGEGDMMMWAEPDSTGVRRLTQSIRLLDGSWHEPELTDSTLMIGDSDYPFMLSDGTTLYFAAQGDKSMGGYDIFRATRDPADDTYFEPANIGMPYNSPADDFMMAIDEVNNVGWWASDRENPGGDVTIYIFIPNEMRNNLDPESVDEEDILAFAELSDIEVTWPDSADYSGLLATIRAIEPGASGVAKPQFRLLLPGGEVYTQYDDFVNPEAADMMREYLELVAEYNDAEAALTTLRGEYHEYLSETLAQQILQAEADIEQLRKKVREERSDVIRKELCAIR